MIIQENDFLKTYNNMSRLWEDVSENVTIVKGKPYKFLTSFMPVRSLSRQEFSRPGIYIWKRLPYEDKDPAYYVGKTVNLYTRTEQHTKAGKRDSRALHLAIKEHGLDAFEIAVIEVCALDELSDRESYWIEELNTFLNKYDYNLTPGGEGGSGPSKVTPEMFKHIVTQLRDTDLTFAAIAAQEEVQLNWTTISDLNVNRYSYEEEFAKMLNLDVTFPIRSAEEVERIQDNVRAQNKEKQSKTWRLILQHRYRTAKGKIALGEAEDLGIFLGKGDIWTKICENERAKYNTSTEELQRAYGNFGKGAKRAAACFEPFSPKIFARKYIIQEITAD